MQGMEESAIENLTLQNIHLRITRPFDYSWRAKHAGGSSNPDDDRITRFARQPSYCTLANLRNLHVDNLRVEAVPGGLETFSRSALSVFHARGALLRSVACSPAAAAAPVMELHDVRTGLVTGCVAAPGTEIFLRCHEMDQSDVLMEANNLRNARHSVEHSARAG
jgi:hypothetical protein